MRSTLKRRRAAQERYTVSNHPTITSVDKISRVIAILSLLISLLTFAMSFFVFSEQFLVVRDSVSYFIADLQNSDVPPDSNSYVSVSLTIFNRGNRSAILISATAFLYEHTLASVARITNDDCNSTTSPVYGLLPHSIDIKGDIQDISDYKYDKVIEAKKSVTNYMSFSIYENKITTRHNMEGIVCLELKFADSDGNTRPVDIALEGIRVQVTPNNVPIIKAPIKAHFSSPVIVINNRPHIEWPVF